MCGIAGIVSPDPGRLARIGEMTRVQAHRGPDGVGYLLLGQQARLTHDRVPDPKPGDFLALGHRRLAIVDTTEAGLQPMRSADGLDWISYNGEVYNHVELRLELERAGHAFSSHSDTEVILAAYRHWGLDCFKHFNGMWAIALWDGRRRRLVLSRDRLGVKPLCYAQVGLELIFASEVKAVLGTGIVQPRLNRPLAMDFLRWSVVNHTHESFFTGVASLPPGHYAIVDVDAPVVRPQAYWTLSPPDVDTAASPYSADTVAARFRELFEDAVRLRLRSDVPVGSCLSGGLDSSAIVCQAQALQPAGSGPINTFNAACKDPRFDERTWCEIVNRHVAAKAHFTFPEATAFVDDFDALLWHQEEPFTTASIYAQWMVMRNARAERIPVLLDGQGADEVLCGYRKFHWFHLRDLVRRRRWASAIADAWQLWRHGDRTVWRWRDGARYLPATLRSRVPSLADHLRHGAVGAWSASAPGLTAAGSVAERQIDDLARFSVPSLLRYEDRNSMAWSIESRVPFLDYRLVEWLVSLPPEVKIAGGRTKAVMRHALRGIVPDEILDRRDKMGFATAQEDWMRGPLGSMIERTLKDQDFPLSDWFDPGLLRQAYRDWVTSGRGLPQQDLFRLIVLARWMRRFDVTF
jgi:asparagine synthase (glutamine-hydrolysing)